MPNLVILDLVMPGVHGFDVLKWIKHRPEPLYVPAVVLTASRSPGDARRSLELGALAVYQKPYQLDQLQDVVTDIVERWIGRSAFSWLRVS